MRLRDITICFVCIILAIGLLIAAGAQLDYINSQRQKMNLISNEPMKNAPPSLAFATVAMGAFRGLVVDVLWLRADRLKEQGQFFDAKQLAEWITTLQPRFASVWEFHAWNMAYNISVAIPATQPDQRWRWVKNGYELLRDQGIELNPKSISLYRELGRIFQHKIGGVSDDAHKYYKLQLAMAMEPLLGSADNKLDATDNGYFEALAKAPTDWQQIAKDANIFSLISALKSADKAFADDDNFVSNYLSLRQNPGRFNPDAFRVIDNFRGTEALKRFDIFAKAHQLHKAWKFDPVLMRELNKTYGPIDWNDPNKNLPLDWRHPDTHAIYWAVKGLQIAGKGEFSIEQTNTDRIVVHGLQDLFRNGKIFIYKPPLQEVSGEQQPTSPEVFLRPDLRMFEPYNKAILKVIGKYTDPNQDGYSSHQIGHRNMLENAVLSFYQAGHERQAQKIYNQLRQLYPSDDFKVPLVGFVRNRLTEELQSIDINNAKEIVIMMLREAYFRYAMRDDDTAASRENWAKEVYDRYNEIYKPEERIDLPDFKMLRYFAFTDFLYDWQYPLELRLSLLGRIKIERPDLFQQLQQQEEQLRRQQESMLEKSEKPKLYPQPDAQ